MFHAVVRALGRHAGIFFFFWGGGDTRETHGNVLKALVGRHTGMFWGHSGDPRECSEGTWETHGNVLKALGRPTGIF